jgi:uncharacterized protein YqjF (DUF2071 family)
MREYLVRTSQIPRPLPSGHWMITQRWNDLLFAHWPVPPAAIAPLIPDGLHLDTIHGSAWIGVVPFCMDRIKLRGLPPIPFTRSFPELNLRTYVRDQQTGTPGVYFLSLDANNLAAVLFARTVYNLPYHWAEIKMEQRSEREFAYYSRRRGTRPPVIFKARYRGLGPTRKLAESRSGSLEFFLTERYCLFTRGRNGEPMRANVHHVPWPLEEAEAEIERNDLPAAAGIKLPDVPPVLHYSRRLAVYVWQLERLHPARAQHRIPAEAMPSV